MPRASGSRLSKPAKSAAWPQATPPPIRAASRPTATRLVRRGWGALPVAVRWRLTSANEGAVANCYGCYEHAKHQEWLGTCLIFNIKGDWITQQPDVLEGDLGNNQQHQ